MSASAWTSLTDRPVSCEMVRREEGLRIRWVSIPAWRRGSRASRRGSGGACHHGRPDLIRWEVIGDRLLGDRLVSDRLVGDRLVGGRLLGDRLVDDQSLGTWALGAQEPGHPGAAVTDH